MMMIQNYYCNHQRLLLLLISIVLVVCQASLSVESSSSTFTKLIIKKSTFISVQVLVRKDVMTNDDWIITIPSRIRRRRSTGTTTRRTRAFSPTSSSITFITTTGTTKKKQQSIIITSSTLCWIQSNDHCTTKYRKRQQSNNKYKYQLLMERTSTNIDTNNDEQQEHDLKKLLQIEYKLLTNKNYISYDKNYNTKIVNNNSKNKNNKNKKDNNYYYYNAIIGSDDSGTGAIAGPIVTVSCCICYSYQPNQSNDHNLANIIGKNNLNIITDSKKLSYNQCLDIYNTILQYTNNTNNTNNNQQMQDSQVQQDSQVLVHVPKIFWSYAIRTSTEIDTLVKQNSNPTQHAFNESIYTITQSIASSLTNRNCNQNHSYTDTTLSSSSTTGNQQSSTSSKLTFYSIVDGHKSPKPFTIIHNTTTIQVISKPWKNGDNEVYTVSVASIIARVIRQQYLDKQLVQLSSVLPSTLTTTTTTIPDTTTTTTSKTTSTKSTNVKDLYEFSNHGGYPTRRHIQLLHQYGPILSLHRYTTKPVQDIYRTIQYYHNSNNDKTNGTTTNNSSYDNAKLLLNVLDNKQQHHLQTLELQNEGEYQTTTATAGTVFDKTSLTTSSNERRRTILSLFIGSFGLLQNQLGVLKNSASATIATPAMLDIDTTTSSSSASVVSSLSNTNTNLISRVDVLLPQIGEIENAIPTDWSIIDNPYSTSTSSGSSNTASSSLSSSISSSKEFSRLDSNDDTIFYKDPRFVEHVDEQGVQIITKYISKIISEYGSSISSQSSSTTTSTSISPPATTIQILDLCSSWTSHIDTTKIPSSLIKLDVTGLGMNQEELQSNTILNKYIVQDLNKNPLLTSIPSNTYDIILLQLSIDYLIQPYIVCSELLRILKPNTGTIHILYSNRLFISKVIALWTSLDDIDRTFTVASYLHFCSSVPTTTGNEYRFNDIRAIDLSIRSNRQKQNTIIGDPIYVVTARKEKV